METYFTSDTHFGHTNIIGFCDRPFDSIHSMNEALIFNWNSVVDPNDHVYHLGDFALCPTKAATEIAYALNGKIHLVEGNHDRRKNVRGSLKERFEWVKSYHEMNYEKTKIVLCHFPSETWNKSHRGSWHLHGHSHGNLPSPTKRRQDVGVDTNDFYPYHLEEIAKIMSCKELNVEGGPDL